MKRNLIKYLIAASLSLAMAPSVHAIELIQFPDNTTLANLKKIRQQLIDLDSDDLQFQEKLNTIKQRIDTSHKEIIGIGDGYDVIRNNPHSSYIGLLAGIGLGGAATALNHTIATCLIDKTGISKNPTILKRITSFAAYAGIHWALVKALQAANHGLFLTLCMNNYLLTQYPALTAGTMATSMTFTNTLNYFTILACAVHAVKQCIDARNASNPETQDSSVTSAQNA
jgi:hypothetical protein